VTFVKEDEAALAAAFLAKGFVIVPTEDREALDRIRDFIADRAAEHLSLPPPGNRSRFLDTIHEHIADEAALNELRLAIIGALLATPWFREAYFSCGRRTLEALVGNELAMQRGIGFSIQLPQDRGSMLPLHSDVWSEDSPFEVVLWIPFVDVARTKSMYALPLDRSEVWRDRMASYAGKTVEDFYDALSGEVEFLEVPYGHVLCFTHTIMHGNRTNEEATTRWSMNVRFKGLFTPYSDKRLGDFFIPISLRPASRIGMQYRLPGGFDV
jgi:sporadic carbohydrate cluster 2OG-Fe(II) oxygenase